MAKDPAILWYYQDYLNGTEDMSFAEQGAYMRLLCKQCDKGPMSIEFIQKILKGSFQKLWPGIKKKFMESEGVFFNERIEKEKDRRQQFLDRVTRNGMKGGRPKKNLQDNLNETEKEPIGYVSVNLNKSIIENENEIKDRGTGKGFELSAKIPLPELTQEAAEMNQFTMTQNRNTVFVQQQWKIFLKERMNELPQKKYYSISDLTSYFLNWVRTKHPKKDKFEPVVSTESKLKKVNF